MSVADAESNIKCSIDIMSDLLKAEDGIYKSSGYLYGRKNNSYWEHLRRHDGGSIGNLIRTHPLCDLKR